MRSLENTSAATKRSLTLSISRPLLVPSARRKPPASGCSSRCHPNFRVVYAAGKTIRLLATACAKISAPFLFSLPAHRLARRVLRLEPHLRRPGAIWRIRPLRHDALKAQAADMIEHGRAVPFRCAMYWIDVPLALPSSLLSRRLRSISGRSRKSSPSCWIRSKAYSSASWPSAPQRVEVRRPVVADDHHLAVDQERRRLDASSGVNDSREAVGPVMAVAREAANARAIPAHHQPVAVVLDLVNPQRAGRWPLRPRRQAWFDKAGGMAQNHERRMEQ